SSPSGNSTDAVTLCAILLEHGANFETAPVKQIDPPMNIKPLHVACLSGNKDLVRLLLDSGASKEVADTSGKTPLDYARSTLKTWEGVVKSKSNSSNRGMRDRLKEIVGMLSID
ncbi:MAG: ankyrin repeat domain-containing protein, partial [Pirellulales bacterium]|nr:ankyrin repeat domain-containing protein [Pirellulales bacterium]